MAPVKSLIFLKAHCHAKMAPDNLAGKESAHEHVEHQAELRQQKRRLGRDGALFVSLINKPEKIQSYCAAAEPLSQE